MSKQLIKDTLGWGFLGILALLATQDWVLSLFLVVPVSLIGWTTLLIGTIITLWVLFKRSKAYRFGTT